MKQIIEEKNCIFCKIVKGELPAQKAYEDEHVVAFHDINPIAKVHVLFIHRHHSHNVLSMIEDQSKDLMQVFKAIKIYAEENKFDDPKKGFRLINNCGAEGGQSVFHTHFHFLAGEKLRWG